MHVNMIEMMRNREKESIRIECLCEHVCASKLLKACKNEIKQGGRNDLKNDNRRLEETKLRRIRWEIIKEKHGK